MFKPKYTISAKLLANIKRIAALIAELNSRRLSKVVGMALEKEARELSTFASTRIEGNPLPLTEVKRILKNKPANLRDSEREVMNYNRALELLHGLSQKGEIDCTLKLILEIHKIVTKGLGPKDSCGQIRREPVFVNDPRTGKTIYWPPDDKDARPLLEELVIFINHNRTAIDPLILAGLFHKQFVVIHPFMDGNGRTARLLTKVLLAAMGLNTFNLFSFENYYNRNITGYFAAVGVSNNYYDIKNKIVFTGWLEYFTDGIVDELLRVSQEWPAAAGPGTILRPQDHLILERIKQEGYITDKDYRGLTKRAKATRNKDFNKLIVQGLIEKSGKGKATYYKLP
jgi:Fic family protein